jgi:hypothetical protein
MDKKKIVEKELEEVEMLQEEMNLVLAELAKQMIADEPVITDELDKKMEDLQRRVDEMLGSGGVRS